VETAAVGVWTVGVVVGLAAALGVPLLLPDGAPVRAPAPAVRSAPEPSVPAARRSVAASRGHVAQALRVLASWDGRRGDAYAAGSAAALGRLYVPGSSAGAADVRLLRAYRSRGLRVVGLRTQVLALVVEQRAGNRWRLRVTDRVVGAVAVSGGRRLPLPRDASSVRVVTLVRSPGRGWQASSVADALSPGPP
jgi:hypothetical protein